ncbi:aldehyde dehydrogenase family protein [Cupriavidus sp. AU9028]|uniref:aldehyde dehydrogenase family protein n=1 Tax=Cupriavidus sp. AU9028 TaxID=2871157 RepID=UPI001C957218|nr:aldehyde dehydrogenase family protein [Cupriavidus sp. AU9028]MBY4895552.1 aldehyde dehydrogenase family protein [Cupriavidus sp. AU9028]
MHAQHFIANRLMAPDSGLRIKVFDPSTGAPFAEVARGNATDVNAGVHAARQALGGPWGETSPMERGRVLMRLANLLAEQEDALAKLEARDTGKPLRQAHADARAVARYFEFYAGAADKLHGETLPYQNGYTVLTLREPHGVTGHIIPWNYPLQIFGRSVAAALAAGNACVVKPAEDACLSLLRVAELAAEAGLPPGALNLVTGYGHEAGAALARHPGIDHLSFTGSPETGKLVAQLAAENHVPVTLELGGKSPQIVFTDADLDALVPVIVNGIVQNAGQTCSAGSRVLVERPLYDALLDRLATVFEALRVGPWDQEVDCGPLISRKQQQRVWDFVSDAQHAGIAVMAQGQIIAEAPETGFYQVPMLLRDVPPQHRLAQEEVFGPLLAAMPFDTEDEAIALANGTPYGLVAGLWTRDGARQLRIARKVRAGQVFINNYGAGGGVELPFGGSGRSGHGREKGFEALYGFTTLKTIAIQHG